MVLRYSYVDLLTMVLAFAVSYLLILSLWTLIIDGYLISILKSKPQLMRMRSSDFLSSVRAASMHPFSSMSI